MAHWMDGLSRPADSEGQLPYKQSLSCRISSHLLLLPCELVLALNARRYTHCKQIWCGRVFSAKFCFNTVRVVRELSNPCLCGKCVPVCLRRCGYTETNRWGEYQTYIHIIVQTFQNKLNINSCSACMLNAHQLASISPYLQLNWIMKTFTASDNRNVTVI